MRRNRGRNAVLVVILGLVVALAAGEILAAKPKTTVTGVVKRAEVYAGKVRAVYIEAAEGDEYLVMRGTDIGKELLGHVGATLSATGYVRKATRDPEFELAIDVLEYEILAAAEPKGKPAKKDDPTD